MKNLVVLDEKKGIPLLGLVYIGIVDRGSNLIQVRPTTICNLNCPFCSVDSGPFSKVHKTDYIIEKEYLLRYVKDVVEFKGDGTEVNLDTVGEITTYPDLVWLIKEIKKLKKVYRISMQSNGINLDKNKIKKLEKAGLNRINLSLSSMDPELAKELSGVANFDIEHIKDVARWINESKIELLVAPIWMPGINDMEPIIVFCKELGAKIGIQKYEVHKYGRKVKAKEMTFFNFYKQLDEWDKKLGHKLKLGPLDFNIKKVPRLPDAFKKGEMVNVIVKEVGWGKDQMIGVANNRAVTIVKKCKIGQTLRAKVISVKDGVYLVK